MFHVGKEMISQLFQQQKQQQELQQEQEQKKIKAWMVMDHPELSLGPSQFAAEATNSSSSSKLEVNLHRKRKYRRDLFKSETMIQSSIELQLKDPLPLDWEQCLDLESGRMYYMNRNTLKKRWHYPNDEKLDLELNISPLSGDDQSPEVLVSKRPINSGNSMVAVACLKCHLLVMLSKSSPSCPNCKYVNSQPTQQIPSPKVSTVKSLETLSLLH